jgi:ABC-type ATPase with predicted acetyltransferase domain
MEFDIKKAIEFKESFRNKSIIGKFDLNPENYQEHFQGKIDLEDKEWNIGLIVGNSGTGKTTIAKQLFGENIIQEYPFNRENSVMDDMPQGKSVEEITQIFNKVGFSSPPSWLKPHEVLSNGEKMRVELAYNLLSENELTCFDEFTSVVDRNVAKITSTCIQKTIRKLDKKFIAVGCHFDIVDWLEPDWIFDTNQMKFFFIQNQSAQQDQKSNLEFIKQMTNNGELLESITI